MIHKGRIVWAGRAAELMDSGNPMKNTCICGIRRGCTVIRSGMLTCDSAIRFTTSRDTAVVTATGNSAWASGTWVRTGCEVASRTSANTFSNCPWKSWSACSASSSVMSPRPMRDSV